MYIRKTKSKYKGKTYTNFLLVESVLTEKGPRQKTICSLGNLEPAPPEQWLAVAHKMESALKGQMSLEEPEARVEAVVSKIGVSKKLKEKEDSFVLVNTDKVETEEAREAGSVHVGHQMWKRLGMDSILSQAGLSERTRLLTEVMTLNRFIKPHSEHAMPDWIRETALSDILTSIHLPLKCQLKSNAFIAEDGIVGRFATFQVR